MITYDVHVQMGIDTPHGAPTIKCHDTGVNLRIHPEVTKRLSTFRKITEPYSIPPDATTMLKIAKPDKKYVVTKGEVQGDSLFFMLPPQSFTVYGKARAEVNIYGADGRRVTTGTFILEISEECICDCEEDSETYVDIIIEQVGAAEEARLGAEEAKTGAEEAKRDAEEAATHPPYVGGNGNWMIWDNTRDEYVDSGSRVFGESLFFEDIATGRIYELFASSGKLMLQEVDHLAWGSYSRAVKAVALIDQQTDKPYSLYIENGKLMYQESEVQ